MEISFREEIKSLALGQGQTFHGEGILAITKALLQSGVAYVGGYQGAPVSHLLHELRHLWHSFDEGARPCRFSTSGTASGAFTG